MPEIGSLEGHSTGEEKDGGEEDVCRICRSEGTPSKPLHYPCACSGSIKYVHQDCLLAWLKHSASKHCEVCKHTFSFRPVYAPGVPAWLPPAELAAGLASKARRSAAFMARLSLVVTVWLVVPLLTCWLWRLCFLRSLSQGMEVIQSRLAPQQLVTDCVYGSVLSGIFVFVFFAAISLREMHLNHLWQENDQDPARMPMPLPAQPQIPDVHQDDLLRDLDRLADEVAPPPRHQPRPAADQAGERLARGRDTNRRRFAEQLQNERHFGIVVGADGVGRHQRRDDLDVRPNRFEDLRRHRRALPELNATFPPPALDLAHRNTFPPPAGPRRHHTQRSAAAAASGAGGSGFARQEPRPFAQPREDDGDPQTPPRAEGSPALPLFATYAADEEPEERSPMRGRIIDLRSNSSSDDEGFVPEMMGGGDEHLGRGWGVDMPPRPLEPRPGQLEAHARALRDAEGWRRREAFELQQMAQARQARGVIPERAGMAEDVLAEEALGEEMSFEELVGLKGPIMGLVENSLTVLACNMVLLAITVLLPFSLGRRACHVFAWLQRSPAARSAGAAVFATARTWRELAANVVGSLLAAAYAFLLERTHAPEELHSSDTNISADSLLANLSTAQANMSESVLTGAVADAAQPMEANVSAAGLSAVEGVCKGGNAFWEDYLRDWCTASTDYAAALAYEDAVESAEETSDIRAMVVGYSLLLSMGFWGCMMCCAICYTMRTLFCVQSAPAVCQLILRPLSRRIAASLHYAATVVKVMILLLVELGLFPAVCGVWLDICTLSLMGAQLSGRVAFWRESPFVCALLHWAAGVAHMLYISRSVATMRDALRPGVLAFLRDPSDPNFNPFRDLVEDSMLKHMRRVVISAMVYANLTVLMVYSPAVAARRLAPSIFPLVLDLKDPVLEVPLGILMFNLMLAVRTLAPQPFDMVRSALAHWLKSVGRLLELEDFLLPVLPGISQGDPHRKVTVHVLMRPTVPTTDADPWSLHSGDTGERAVKLEVPVGLRLSQLKEAVARHTGLQPAHLRVAAAPSQQQPQRQGWHVPREASDHTMHMEVVGSMCVPLWDENHLFPALDPEPEGGDAGEAGEWRAPPRLERLFVVKMLMLLLIGWGTVLTAHTTLLCLPAHLGRLVLRSARLPTNHDGLAATMGCVVLWGAATQAVAARRFAARGVALRQLLAEGRACVLVVMRLALVAAVWLILLPMLLGLAVDMIVAKPLWEPGEGELTDKTLWRDWANGLLMLQGWHTSVMSENVQISPAWRNKFERVKRTGVMHIELVWALREMALPLLLPLVAVLAVPYALVQYAMPFCGARADTVAIAHRYVHLAGACTVVGWQGARWLRATVMKLHDSILDERYLVGQDLTNCERTNRPAT
mmetsp:Transcript_44216/g.84534  ORF Transcript_44216/g.84534 Transcript_44216/m.84534 type:complete len:1376 (+) Transcript_44216:118-4245(+)